jgi:hypothetical protein
MIFLRLLTGDLARRNVVLQPQAIRHGIDAGWVALRERKMEVFAAKAILQGSNQPPDLGGGPSSWHKGST